MVHRPSILFLLQKFSRTDGRKGGSLVYDWCVVDLLVNTNGLVDDGGLDGLTLDDRLDGLVDMVVLVLIHVLPEIRLAPLYVELSLHVLVHRALLVKLVLVFGEHLLFVLSGDGIGCG